jgi:GNAT superfamily N-acetyltransferase
MMELFQRQQQAVAAEADLPGRREWVEKRSFRGIWFWDFFECMDFLNLSPTTQRELPGSTSAGVSRLAVRIRIFAILDALYIDPQYKGARIGHRGPYEVLRRQLMAQTYNLAQAKAGVLDPVAVRAGNGRTMNGFAWDVHEVMNNRQ